MGHFEREYQSTKRMVKLGMFFGILFNILVLVLVCFGIYTLWQYLM